SGAAQVSSAPSLGAWMPVSEVKFEAPLVTVPTRVAASWTAIVHWGCPKPTVPLAWIEVAPSGAVTVVAEQVVECATLATLRPASSESVNDQLWGWRSGLSIVKVRVV